jgi:hypothetical protein
MSDHAKTLADAVSQVLRHVNEATQPITSIKVWRYNESMGGGYGWSVVESPPSIEHGTALNRFRNTGSRWHDLAKQLINEFENLAAKADVLTEENP